MIAGFPTETEEHFANAMALVDDCDLSFLHVFPYSPRPQTPAAKMPQLPKPLIKERAMRLRDEIAVLKGQGDSGSAAVRQPPPGQMGLGTHIPVAAPPKGWKPPKKPDSLTKGKPRR